MHQTGDPQLTNQLYRDRHLDVRSYLFKASKAKKKSADLFTLQMISTVPDRTF